MPFERKHINGKKLEIHFQTQNTTIDTVQSALEFYPSTFQSGPKNTISEHKMKKILY